MIEYYNNILCVKSGWLYGAGNIITKSNYDILKHRSSLKQTRRGGNGRSALIEYNSIPDRFKQKIIEKIGGNPYEIYKAHWFQDFLRTDHKAYDYFNTYKLGDGRYLPTDKVKLYSTQAMFFNAITIVKKQKKRQSKKIYGSNEKFDFWEHINEILIHFEPTYYHNLPTKSGSLRHKFTSFRKDGYDSLISRKYSNTNSLKTYPQIIRLLLSIYVHENLPFADKVHKKYMEFITGTKEIIDLDTGEIFNREDFKKNGEPITISEATVYNVINKPEYEDMILSMRMAYSKYKLNKSPYMRRKLPEFSLSKISIDDRMIRKDKDGNPVWIYLAFEPLSGVIIAKSYDKDGKSGSMIRDMLRDLYYTCLKNNLRWPGELEFEHHLTGSYIPMFDKLFQYTRLCAASNSREKRAEHGIKQLKYGAEKDIFANIGRWYGKGVYQNKEDYKEKKSYKEIVADSIAAIDLNNNSEHPHFKGKTRWEVLTEKQNPDLSRPQKFRILKEIGNKTATTVRQSDYVRIQYNDYWIDTSALALLEYNNKTVDAYWLPEADGIISEAYLYQGDKFICKAELIEQFNESRFERTEDDTRIMQEQFKRLANHRKRLHEQKEKLIFKHEEMSASDFIAMDAVVPETIEDIIPDETNTDFYDESNESDEEYYKQRALKDF
ncbi:MAG: hypothetical protein IMY72_11925 [Bacteroidetes bacterium]|nr:hypothetical protein [Bacteroidota bacterium]